MLIVLKVLALILIVVFCLILTLLLGLLLFPFHCKGTLKKNKEHKAIVDVSWLLSILGLELVFLPKRKFISFKLFKVKIVTFTIRPKPPEIKKEKALKKAEKKAKKKERKRKKRKPFEEQQEQIMATIGTFSVGALKEVVVFLMSLFSSLRLKLSGEVEAGLSDPADTGMLLGLFYAIDGVFNVSDFKLYPNWEESIFKENITLYGRVWLADFILIAARFMLTSSIRRIWWPKVKEKIKFWGNVKLQAAAQ